MDWEAGLELRVATTRRNDGGVQQQSVDIFYLFWSCKVKLALSTIRG
jgi:hypothetical protein